MSETFPYPDTAVVMFPVVGSRVDTFPMMDTGTGVFPTPPVFTEERLASVIADLTPSVSWVIVPWRVADAGTSPVPKAVVSPSVALTAPVTADMTLSAIYGTVMDAPLSADMTPGAVVVPSVAGTAPVSFNPDSSINPDYIDVIVVADVRIAVDVAAQIQVYGVITAPVTAIPVPGGVVKPSPRITAGVSTAFAPDATLTVVTFTATGVTKNSSEFNVTGTRSPVTGWIVNSSYPSTVLSGNGFQVKGSKSNATITGTFPGWTNSFNTSRTLYLMLNGTQIGTANSASGTSSMTVSASGVNVANGDVITVEAVAGYSSGVSISANTATIICT